MEFDVDGYIANEFKHRAGSTRISYEIKVHNLHKIRFPRYVDWKASKSKNRFDIIFNFPERVILNGNEQITALLSEDGFPNAIKQATLAIVDDRTIKWENVPGLLTTSDSVLNLKFENILLPSLPHLPSGIMNMIGYMHFIIVRHDTGKFVDQFLGHTETFALTGETFAGHQLCQTPFSDTRIRLVGRNYASDYIGRLEMFKRGVWGKVGGRNFKVKQAVSTCKNFRLYTSKN